MSHLPNSFRALDVDLLAAISDLTIRSRAVRQFWTATPVERAELITDAKHDLEWQLRAAIVKKDWQRVEKLAKARHSLDVGMD